MLSRIDETRRRLALGLMVASGFAALAYQIVWTQQATIWLGHESAAVLAVVAAFFGGLALGAWTLGPRADLSARPALWYAACEAAIGLWSLALAFLMAPAGELLLLLTGAQPSAGWQWSVAFFGTFVLLLPATAAMGATFPAMERVLARMQREGSSIAALYAGNTLGAMAGVMVAAFWLVPHFGLLRTAGVCAALNLGCAVAALKLFADDAARQPDAVGSPTRGALPLLAVTGLLGIGYEVLVVRVVSQVAENTVYTFAMLLAVYLVGTALGAAAYQRRPLGRDRLLRLLTATCVLGTASLWAAESLKAIVLHTAGPSMAAALAAEGLLAVAAFLLPTVVMGALFSHLGTQARAAGISFGHALGMNTMGAAIAPLLFGVVLVPAIGPKFALLFIATAYLVLSARLTWPSWVIAGVILALGLFAPALRFIDVPPGGHVVSYREGAKAAVSVVEDAGGVARLRIDNREQEGSSATGYSDTRQALLPLLLHPSPHRALFLGIGTGATASAAAEDPLLQVDAVELVPEVIDASAYFRHKRGESLPNPRLHLIAADARRYVRSAQSRYDVIVSDNFHPARAGSGSLYTVEHFGAVRERLAAGGLFCQWLPLHQLDLGTLRSIVRSFLATYPEGWAMLATNSLDTPIVGLVALRGADRFDAGRVRQHREFGIEDELALLGTFIAGPRALARFAGAAALNTDDRPIVSYRAPRATYAPESLPRDRLIALLSELRIAPEELVSTSTDAAWRARLAAYWSARNRYLEAGREVRPTADVRRMLSQVREPLLSVLRISPDFRPAYDPLLRMASALARVDAAEARVLLSELRDAQPERPEATQALRELSSASR